MMMPPPTTWVLVADATRARLFAVDHDGRHLVRPPAWTGAAEAPPSRDLGSDRPGRTFESTGSLRHAKEPPTDPHRFAKTRFAREIAATLDDMRARDAFDRLVVVAPPQMLGDLRAAMGPPLAARVAVELDKDLAMLAPHALDAHLADVLAPRP